jgi:hypothetical protein
VESPLHVNAGRHETWGARDRWWNACHHSRALALTPKRHMLSVRDLGRRWPGRGSRWIVGIPLNRHQACLSAATLAARESVPKAGAQ